MLGRGIIVGVEVPIAGLNVGSKDEVGVVGCSVGLGDGRGMRVGGLAVGDAGMLVGSAIVG